MILSSEDRKIVDSKRGCLIGGAIGDALGYPIEFLSYNDIVSTYGPLGIKEFDTKSNSVALISDDTQMSMFTMEGLLLGNDKKDYLESIRFSYLCWYVTQKVRYNRINPYPASKLTGTSQMYFRRAPGTTCLLSCERGATGTIESPLNNSKGCGGVMRVAPIGVFFDNREKSQGEIDMLGAEAAAMTHGHPLGYIPAAMLVHIVNKIIYGRAPLLEAIEDSKESVKNLFPDKEETDVLISLIDKAVHLAKTDRADIDCIRELGKGWVAEETLAIAIYCCLKHKTFKESVLAAVNHDGDSDSTGAVTGNIAGAMYGYKAIPKRYLKNLEMRDLILSLIEPPVKKKEKDYYGR